VSQIGDAAFVVALGLARVHADRQGELARIVSRSSRSADHDAADRRRARPTGYSRKLLLIGSDGARAQSIGVSRSVDCKRSPDVRPADRLRPLHGLGSGLFQPPSAGSCRCSSTIRASARPTRSSGSRVRRPSSSVPRSPGVGLRPGGLERDLRRSTLRRSSSPPRSSRSPPARARARAVEGLRRELTTGFRYVVKVPWLWITIGTFSLVLLIGYAALQGAAAEGRAKKSGTAASAPTVCCSPCRA
jgi:hypothetical protein